MPRQVALGQLKDEVPRMPDEAPAGLEEPLLEARQRPTLNGWGQDEPSQQIEANDLWRGPFTIKMKMWAERSTLRFWPLP